MPECFYCNFTGGGVAYRSVGAAGGTVGQSLLHPLCCQVSLRQETGIAMDPLLLFLLPPLLPGPGLGGRGGDRE